MVDLPLETERLRLRSLSELDTEAVFAILGHAPTTRDVSWAQSSIEGAGAWLERRIANQRALGFSMWGVERLETEGLVGLCGFFPTDDPDMVELGYVIHADHWNRGWASEAARAAVEAMTATGRGVIATIRPANRRSQRVAVNAGLSETGRRHDARGELVVYER